MEGMAEYRHSAHAVFDLKYHIVWCTKYRKKVLRGRIAERARDLIRQICAARDVVIVRGAVSPDHIHLLFTAPPILSPAKLAQIHQRTLLTTCRPSSPNCASNTGGNTCGREATSARRWAPWMRQRSKPISRTSAGTKTMSRSRSRRPPSLKPALSRGPSGGFSRTATFSREEFYRLSAGSCFKDDRRSRHLT
jgi:REP element-mobilizing transposase RayT